MQNYVSMSRRQLTTTKLRKRLSFCLIKNRAEVRVLQRRALLPTFMLQKSFTEFEGTTLISEIKHLLEDLES